MAEDVVALLNFVGWIERRQIHVVGASLGGMIAQGTPARFQLLPYLKAHIICTAELASRVPERIVSLTLIVTKSGGRRLLELPSVSSCFSM